MNDPTHHQADDPSAEDSRMSRSFPWPGHRVPWGLLGMFALVGLFESFVAGHGVRFSRIEPDDWRSTARVAEREVPSGGILILGDSQVKFGISPFQVEAEVGQPAQCLAIQGGQAPSSYFLLRKALQAGMIPSAIVVDFEPNLLREPPTGKTRMWAELATLRECYELASSERDFAEFAGMALGRILPSYRARLEIRGNLMAALKAETSNTSALIELARRNRGMNRGAILMSKDLGNHQHDVSTWGNPMPEPWKANDVNDLYARRLIRLALDHKIPVYAALMPLSPGVQTKYEQSGIDGRYVAWLGKLQSRFPNFHVLDWRHADYGPLAFFDALHLNSVGASSVGSALGNHLKRVGRGEVPVERWTKMPTYKPNVAAVAVEDSSMSDALMRATASLRR